jgi:membrane protease YdiL (CAAX protease family)
MRERWKQAGLVFLSLVVVWLAFEAYKWLANQVLVVSDIKVFFDEAAVVYLVTYLAAVRWIERRIPTEFSVHGALSVLGAGTLAGLALFSLLVAVLWFVGIYRPDGWGDFKGLQLGLVLVFWLAVATEEEIFYRGLVFRLCSKVFGTWGALLLSSVFFGVEHMVGTPQPTAAAFL